MAIWGYWRTSTAEQDSERQEQSLKEAGCERIYGTRSLEPLLMEKDLNSPSVWMVFVMETPSSFMNSIDLEGRWSKCWSRSMV